MRVEELQERMLSYNPNTDLQLVEEAYHLRRRPTGVSTAIQGRSFSATHSRSP